MCGWMSKAGNQAGSVQVCRGITFWYRFISRNKHMFFTENCDIFSHPLVVTCVLVLER